MRRSVAVRLAAACAVTAAAVLLCAPTPVAAHSEPVSLAPASGEQLDEPPSSVTAVFSEELDPASSLTIVDADGDVVANGALDLTDLDHVTMVADLDIGPGVFTVEWTALSADDGDATSGSWSFAVADSDGEVAAVVPPLDQPRHGVDLDHLAIVLWTVLIVLAVATGAYLITTGRRSERHGALE